MVRKWSGGEVAWFSFLIGTFYIQKNLIPFQAEEYMLRRFFSPTIPPKTTTTFKPTTAEGGGGSLRTKLSNFVLESRTLALEFWLHEEHFGSSGKLVVKCASEILGVYYAETDSFVIGKHHVQHKVLQATSSGPPGAIVCISLWLLSAFNIY